MPFLADLFFLRYLANLSLGLIKMRVQVAIAQKFLGKTDTKQISVTFVNAYKSVLD